MLKGINKIVSPELLKVLSEMGHGDEIVIADANFPSANYGKKVIRADGMKGTEMLNAILSLIPLDTYAVNNFIFMETNDNSVPRIWEKYFSIANKYDKNVKNKNIERYSFYERAKNAYAIIATGEEEIYANIIIKKGVIK